MTIRKPLAYINIFSQLRIKATERKRQVIYHQFNSFAELGDFEGSKITLTCISQLP